MKYYKNELGAFPKWLSASPLTLVVIEAFQRGLSIEVHSADNRRGFVVRISDGSISHDFWRPTAPLTEDSAIEICRDKWVTKQLLSEAGVSMPRGFDFSRSDSLSDVLAKADLLQYPIVLKPARGVKGEGVVTDIPDEKSLLSLVDGVLSSPRGYSQWMVEEQIEGEEYRVLVVDGEPVSATGRRKATVSGDGESSIRRLIKRFNKKRKKNPHLRTRLVKVDDALVRVLQVQGFSLEDVPDSGVAVRLIDPANFSAGGVSVDCTESISRIALEVSAKAVNAIPGLFHGGVDVIVDKSGDPYVIEINDNPATGSHHFPAEGIGRNVSASIIEGHFPCVRGVGRHNVVFNLKRLRALVTSGQVEKITLPRVSPETESERILAQGDFQAGDIEAWVADRARSLRISGSVAYQGDGALEVIAAGEPQKLAQFKEGFGTGPVDVRVDVVDVQGWERPVRLGFEVLTQSGDP